MDCDLVMEPNVLTGADLSIDSKIFRVSFTVSGAGSSLSSTPNRRPGNIQHLIFDLKVFLSSHYSQIIY